MATAVAMLPRGDEGVDDTAARPDGSNYVRNGKFQNTLLHERHHNRIVQAPGSVEGNRNRLANMTKE